MPLRRRARLAGLIMTLTLTLVAWVDYNLVLVNPRELRRQTQRLLNELFGEYQPEFSSIEVDLRRGARLRDLVLRDPKTRQVLLRAEAVDFEFGLFGAKGVVIRRASVTAEVSSDFKSSGESTGELPFDPSRIPADLQVSFVDAVVRLHDTATDVDHQVSIGAMSLKLRSGDVVLTGQARYGVLVPPSDPYYTEAQAYQGGADLRFLEVMPSIRIEGVRERNKDWAVRVVCRPIEVHPILARALPRWPKEIIWDELGPSGTMAADARFWSQGGVFDYLVEFEALGGGAKLKAFPYPIRDVRGTFTFVNEMVIWDRVTGHSRGAGHVLGRGIVYIGPDSEKVTVYAHTDFFDIPVDAVMAKTIQLADDVAWDAFSQFMPTGLATGNLVVARGARGEPPQISVDIREIGGSLQALYRDIPILAKNFRGAFKLMEGGVVVMDGVSFDFANGGKARCKGRVLRGDLLYLDIDARDVPISPEILSKLPAKVRMYVEPLRPQGGRCDARVLVRKAEPGTKPVPDIDLTFRDVVFATDEFPHPLRLSGRSEVRLAYPPGTREESDIEPTIKLDLQAQGESAEPAGGLLGVSVKGSVELSRVEGDGGEGGMRFDCDLEARAKRVEVTPALEAQLPAALKPVLARFKPRGALEDLRLKLRRGLRSIDFEAKGEGLTARDESFPLAVMPERLSLEIEDRLVRLRGVTGRIVGGGRFALKGMVVRPPEGEPEGLIVDIEASGDDVTIGPELLAALPEKIREPVAAVEPEGGVDARMRIAMAPGLSSDGGPVLTGELLFRDISLEPMKLAPEGQRLTRRRITELVGPARLTEEALVLEGVRGTFLGSPLSIGGRIARDQSREGAVAIAARLEDVAIDAQLKSELPASAAAAIREYQVEGRMAVELALRGTKDGFETVTSIFPRGLSALEPSLGVPVKNLTGAMLVEGGELSYFDLEGRLDDGTPLRIRRDALAERGTPAGDQRLLAEVSGFGFTPTLVRRLPADFRSVIDQLAPRGDINLVLALHSTKKRAAELAAAEVETQGLTLTAGITLNEVAGSLSLLADRGKDGGLSFRGGASLRRAVWLEQPIEDVSGRLDYNGRRLKMTGIRGRVHGGRLSGYAAAEDSGFRGRMDFHDLSFANVLEGLAKLDEEEEEERELPTDPVTGRVNGWLEFEGKDGQDPEGFGEMSLTNSNVIPVPLLFRITELLAAEDKRVAGFDRINARYHFEGPGFESVIIDRGLLRSPSLDLEFKGRIWLRGERQGEVDMVFLPLDPTDKIRNLNLITRVLKYQLASIRATGPISDPSLRWIPFQSIMDVYKAFGG